MFRDVNRGGEMVGTLNKAYVLLCRYSQSSRDECLGFLLKIMSAEKVRRWPVAQTKVTRCNCEFKWDGRQGAEKLCRNQRQMLHAVIGGFREGDQRGHASQNAKVAFFALHMQCVIHLCSKTNKIYTQYMHFRGFSCPQKAFASAAAPRRPAPTQEVHLCSFSLNFWPLGASSPLVTPISGYAYIRVSNNKQ